LFVSDKCPVRSAFLTPLSRLPSPPRVTHFLKQKRSCQSHHGLFISMKKLEFLLVHCGAADSDSSQSGPSASILMNSPTSYYAQIGLANWRKGLIRKFPPRTLRSAR
jgi:hypothetical protein